MLAGVGGCGGGLNFTLWYTIFSMIIISIKWIECENRLGLFGFRIPPSFTRNRNSCNLRLLPPKSQWFLYHMGAAYSRFAGFLNYDGSSNVLLFILTYGCWFKIILPISAKAPAQTQLRLSLALFFISPAAPPTREVYFSAAALLYMKMKYSRQCQLAVSVKAS